MEIEVSDKELLGRLANVKKKKEALDLAVAQLESCITSRYEANKHIAKETYQHITLAVRVVAVCYHLRWCFIRLRDM